MKIIVAPLIIGIYLAAAQAQRSSDTRASEQVFKNVQVLKGIPADEFMSTMGFFSASLGLNCVYCHVSESLEIGSVSPTTFPASVRLEL